MKRHRPSQDGDELYSDHVHKSVPPLRAVLTRPVVLSIANCFLLSFMDMALRCLQPLFFATPIHLGGMGLPPSTIGLCLGIFGLLDGAAQGLFFAKVIRHLGLKRLFLMSLSCFIPLFALFPIINHFAREWGRSPAVWALVVLRLLFNCVTEMAFGRHRHSILANVTHVAPVTSVGRLCVPIHHLLRGQPASTWKRERRGTNHCLARPSDGTSNGSVPLRVHATE